MGLVSVIWALGAVEGGSGPGFKHFMQVSGISASTGAWSASPDVSRISMEDDIPVHMDSDMSLSSILLSWLLSIL